MVHQAILGGTSMERSNEIRSLTDEELEAVNGGMAQVIITGAFAAAVYLLALAEGGTGSGTGPSVARGRT
jgi:lactobin A/cerein 7B family class IIb bacteriocin